MEDYYNKSEYDHWLSIAPGVGLRCRVLWQWWILRRVEYIDLDKSLGRVTVTKNEIHKR